MYGTSGNVESASKSKLVQYTKAWNKVRSTTVPAIPAKYQHLMTPYQQINHVIKYHADSSNQSFKPSRAQWISRYARQIQLAIANVAAPAISYTRCNLSSHLSRFVIPPDLDPNIPAFNENGLSERHADKNAYVSINAAGKIVLHATPAYHLELITENQNSNPNGNSIHISPRFSHE